MNRRVVDNCVVFPKDDDSFCEKIEYSYDGELLGTF
jgi:hypothetical protein